MPYLSIYKTAVFYSKINSNEYISLDKEERAGCFALIVLCLVTFNVLRLFLTVPWVDLQCVIVVFPDHTHLLFGQ